MAISLPDIVQKVVLNTRDAVAGTNRVQRAFRQMGREAASESAQAAAAITVLQARVDELGDEAARTQRKMAALNRELMQMRVAAAGGRGRGGGGGGKGPLDDLASSFKKVGHSVSFLSGTIKLLKIPAIIFAIGQLISIVGALAGGFIALSGAIGPAFGALAALPGLVAPIVQGFASVLLAVSGVGDGLKAYTKAQDAAKDPSWADAATDAATSLTEAQANLAEATAAANKTGREAPATWEEYQNALEAEKTAQEAVNDALERQSDVARRAGDAQREYDEALSKLDPSVRRFIEKVEEIRPQFEGLRKQAQAGLFPGVVDAMERLRVLFDPIGRIVEMTARVFGNLADQLARLLTSSGWVADLNLFGAVNVDLLERFGGVALDLLDALRHLGVAAVPLVDWFMELAEAFGEWAENWARTGRESGRLAEFFEKTRDILATLGNLLRNTWGALAPIFRGGAELGRDMLDTWVEATARFRDWTRTAEGQRKINEYFDSIRPILRETGRLFSALTKGLISFSTENDQATASMIAQLRTELLPALFDILNTVRGEFGPALVTLLTTFAKTFSLIAGSSGPLVTFVKALTSLFTTINNLLTTYPQLRSLFFLLATLSGTMRAFQFAGFISGVGGIGKAIGKLVTGGGPIHAFTDGLRGIDVTATNAFTRFGGFLRGLPPLVLPAVAAIALIAVGLFKLYQESEQFRSAVQAAGRAVATAWQAVWGVVGPIFTLFGNQLLALVDNIEIVAMVLTAVLLPAALKAAGALLTMGGSAVVSGLLTVAARIEGIVVALRAMTVAQRAAVALKALAAGVIIGGILAIVNGLQNAKNKAKELRAEIESKYDMDTYEGVVGALEETRTTLQALDKEQQMGWFGVLKGAGQWLLPFVENKILDARAAVDELTDAEREQFETATKYYDAIHKVGDELGITAKEADALRIKLGLPIDAPYEDLIGPIGDLHGELMMGAPRADRMATAMKTLADHTATADQKMSALRDSIDAVVGTELDVEQANARVEEAIDNVTAAVAENGRTLDINDEKGRANLDTIHGLIDAVNNQVDAWIAADVPLDEVNRRLAAQRQRLVDALRQMGFTREETDKYVAMLDTIPTQIDTAIELTTPTPEEIAAWAKKVGEDITAYFEANPAQLSIGAGITRVTLPGGVEAEQSGDILRPPMVAHSPILWGEGRGPEAYIPYESRYRSRAVGLLSQVARDFGLTVSPVGHGHRPRSFAAGGMVPHMAIDHIDRHIRRMQAGGMVGGGGGSRSSPSSVMHSYGGIYVQTVDRPTGERLGRDIAWTLIGSRGPAVQKVIR